MYDIIIIGAGIAGVSAAITAKRRGLKVVVVEKNDVGGKLLLVDEIENFPGFLSIKGMELASILKQQLQKFNIKTLTFKEVINVEKGEKKFLVKLSDGRKLEAKSIILAGGVEHKKLNVKGEELVGKGVSYCAICDGFFFKNKKVAVIGGGDTAFSYALFLSDLCKKVYLIHRRKEFRAEEIRVNQLKKRKNVEILVPYVVKEIKGKQKVEGLILENQKTKKIMKLKVDGVFISIGYEPKLNFLKNLDLEFDENGFVKVDEKMRTNVEGFFAAGDVTGREMQIVVAAAQGCVAALNAARWLKGEIDWKN
jgi:thioredoxin reductase (NADPH)